MSSSIPIPGEMVVKWLIHNPPVGNFSGTLYEWAREYMPWHYPFSFPTKIEVERHYSEKQRAYRPKLWQPGDL